MLPRTELFRFMRWMQTDIGTRSSGRVQLSFRSCQGPEERFSDTGLIHRPVQIKSLRPVLFSNTLCAVDP